MAQLVVFGEAAGPVEPGESAFHDPALRQDFEMVQFSSLDHFEGIAEHLFGPVDQRARVAAVDEYLGDGIEAAE